ncbi:hypothetical protein BaRGS_00012473, partial [Batillaria attramentaria]
MPVATYMTEVRPCCFKGRLRPGRADESFILGRGSILGNLQYRGFSALADAICFQADDRFLIVSVCFCFG